MSDLRSTSPRVGPTPKPSSAPSAQPAAGPGEARVRRGAIVDPRFSVLEAASAATDQQPGFFARVGKQLRTLFNGPMVEKWQTREVLEDPDSRYASYEELKAAKAALQNRTADVNAALGKLGARAQDYLTLQGLCGQDLPAKAALQAMLLDGRLTGKKDLVGQGDLLAHLARLAQQPLTTGLERAELLTNLIEELENPLKIAQEGRGTCVATSSTILATRENPAETARLVADLARPAGTAKLSNGATLQRSAQWNDDTDGHRTPSVRLLQPALMEYGNFVLRYDNQQDNHTLGVEDPQPARNWLDGLKDGWSKLRSKIHLPGGLDGLGADRVLQGLTGQKFDMVYSVNRFNRERVWKRLEAASTQGATVPVGLNWEGGGHKVLFEKIEGDHVVYTNPWGQRERLSVAEFKGNLEDANFPPGA